MLRPLAAPLALGLALALGAPVPAAAQPAPAPLVALVVPAHGPDGRPAAAPSPSGPPAPVVREAPESPLTRAAAAVLATPAAAEMLRLERWSRAPARERAAGAGEEARARRAALAGPVYLLLSREDGGFARTGFWLEEAGRRRWVPAGMVDLVVDPASVASGGFEEVFFHELGHLVLRNLVGELPDGPSRKFHSSLTLTDRVTALDEGFAIHLQPLVRERSANPALRGVPGGEGPTALWVSNVDRRMRAEGVRANLFAHRKALPVGVLDPGADPYALWLDEETSAAFDPGTLRSGQELVASEGFVATLLHRLVTDPRLSGPPLAPWALRRFVGQEPPPDSLSPYARASLRLFAALEEAGRGGVDPSAPLAVDVVRAYGRLFPDEKAAAYDVFVRASFGTTLSAEAAREMREMARAARTGSPAFVEGWPASRRRLEAMVADAVAGRVALDAAVGPELWVLNEGFPVAEAPWSARRDRPLAMDLNTATLTEWMTLPGVDAAAARRILAARDARGAFRSVDEAAAVEGAPPGLGDALRSMERAMRRAGGHRRR